MAFESDNPWDFLHKRYTQPLLMVGAKGEAIVGEAETQPDCGIPTVRACHGGVSDIVKRGLDLEPSERRDKFTLVGNVDSVVFIDAQRQEQRTPSFVEFVREVFGFHRVMWECEVDAWLEPVHDICDGC